MKALANLTARAAVPDHAPTANLHSGQRRRQPPTCGRGAPGEFPTTSNDRENSHQRNSCDLAGSPRAFWISEAWCEHHHPPPNPRKLPERQGWPGEAAGGAHTCQENQITAPRTKRSLERAQREALQPRLDLLDIFVAQFRGACFNTSGFGRQPWEIRSDLPQFSNNGPSPLGLLIG